MTHYFDERPGVGSDPTTVDVVLPDLAFTLTTDRGVFSHGHLDVGTSLLLRTAAPPPATGHLLDLGCGAGPIALALARRSPDATVWAVDVNERAIELTRANAERNAIGNVVAATPDAVPDDLRFSAIWSNPPIRIGKRPLHDLLARWLGRLTDTGTATLVVHKHLGADSLAGWLTDLGYSVDRLVSRSGFRVVSVRASDTRRVDGDP